MEFDTRNPGYHKKEIRFFLRFYLFTIKKYAPRVKTSRIFFTRGSAWFLFVDMLYGSAKLFLVYKL